MNVKNLVKLAFCLALVGVVAVGTVAFAKKPGGGGGGPGGCPRDIACADIYDPVICADGIVYGNACYAYRDCAPGPCVSTGGGPVEALR